MVFVLLLQERQGPKKGGIERKRYPLNPAGVGRWIELQEMIVRHGMWKLFTNLRWGQNHEWGAWERWGAMMHESVCGSYFVPDPYLYTDENNAFQKWSPFGPYTSPLNFSPILGFYWDAVENFTKSQRLNSTPRSIQDPKFLTREYSGKVCRYFITWSWLLRL